MSHTDPYEPMVELVASGYEWRCLKCETLNKEIEATQRVTCSGCGVTFEVGDYSHAIGTFNRKE